jgi:hypothetical protein
VTRLRELHEACGGWIYWKGDVGPDDGETFATTEEWREMYAKEIG